MSGRESGWEGVDFKGFRIYPNFGCRERGGGGEDAAILDVGFYIFDWRGDCSRPAVPGHAQSTEARFRDEGGMEVASRLRIKKG